MTKYIVNKFDDNKYYKNIEIIHLHLKLIAKKKY
jgi:hypothetical protein